MRLFETVNEYKLNMDISIRSLQAYSKATGMQTMLINSIGRILYHVGSEQDDYTKEGHCSFCAKLQDMTCKGTSCTNVHLYGSYQAERFGGKYVFFCPLGLTHWVSPIMSDGLILGAVLGGPVLMVNPEDFLLEDLIRKNDFCEEQIKELSQLILDIPIIKPDVVDSLSELLFVVAQHISGVQSLKYEDDRDHLAQQSGISEYIHRIKTMGGEDVDHNAYPLEKEKELLSLIALGDQTGSQKVLNEIFGYVFFSTGGNYEIIKARVLELVVLLSRAALEGGADVEQIFGLNYKYLNEIHGFKTIEELTYWLSKIMGRFTDCVFDFANIKHADVIYKAVDYIKRNYMKKIALEEVASYVYLSPSYFSKIFKEEMGDSFVTYLNRYRIKVSMKLLMDETIELVDISNLVGYEDQSYFSKTFKKITGITPGKYRESRGQVKINPL